MFSASSESCTGISASSVRLVVCDRELLALKPHTGIQRRFRAPRFGINRIRRYPVRSRRQPYDGIAPGRADIPVFVIGIIRRGRLFVLLLIGHFQLLEINLVLRERVFHSNAHQSDIAEQERFVPVVGSERRSSTPDLRQPLLRQAELHHAAGLHVGRQVLHRQSVRHDRERFVDGSRRVRYLLIQFVQKPVAYDPVLAGEQLQFVGPQAELGVFLIVRVQDQRLRDAGLPVTGSISIFRISPSLSAPARVNACEVCRCVVSPPVSLS